MDRHEWTVIDHMGRDRRCRVVRDPLTLSPAESSSETTFTAEMFAGAEILRLAEEVAALRAVIERDGDIRRVAPVLDAAERHTPGEIYAATVAERKKQADRERARIRRELERECRESGGLDFDDIARVCPESPVASDINWSRKDAERSRLRPLLERCLHTMSPGVLVSEDALAELLADLRLELGPAKEG